MTGYENSPAGGPASGWKVRYAPHLGLRAPDQPLLPHGAGGTDPLAQIRHAAALGFAGIQDNFLKLRPAVLQQRMGEELASRGLAMGCFVNNLENWNQPLWGSASAAARAELRRDLQASIEASRRVRGRCVTAVSARDPAVPLAYQHARMIANLRELAPLAEDAGLVIAIESTSERQLPGMLVHHIADAYAIVEAVDSPAVKLAFDIAHVQAMDGDVLANLAATWDAIAVIQVADQPGRLDLGSGELNWVNLLRYIGTRGYDGLIELEHELATPTPAGEADMLLRLRAIDAAV